MKKTLTVLAAAALLAGCGHSPMPLATPAAPLAVSAQDRPLVKAQIRGLIKVYFRYIDRNDDGKLSKKELARQSPGPFLMSPYFDKNKDGHLSEPELLELMGATVDAAARVLHAACDLDFDGKVTRDDCRKIPFSKYLFVLMDANDDGEVTLSELERFITGPAKPLND